MENKRHYTAAILAIILAAASVFGIVYVSASISKTADDVSFTVVESSGAPSWAEGLKLSFTEEGAVWFYTGHELEFTSKDPAGEAELSVRSDSYYLKDRYNTSFLRTDVLISLSKELDTKINNELRSISQGMDKGESKTIRMRLRDLFEYYPLNVMWKSPDSIKGGHILDSDTYDYMQSYNNDYVYDQFAKLFSLPVPEDETVECYVGQDSFGALHYRIGSDFSAYKLEISGILFGDYYYLAAYTREGFSGLSNKVWRIPCGELPVPIKTSSGTTITKGPLVDKAELVIELEGSYAFMGNYPIKLSEDETALFVLAYNGEDSRFYCVTDADGTSQLSVVDVPGCRPELNLVENELFYPYNYLYSGDSLFFRGKGYTICCIHPENGRYVLTVFPEDIDVTAVQTGSRRVSMILRCAYKDGKLAVVRYVHKKATSPEGELEYYYGGLCVSICSEEKVEYSALIESSISEGIYYPADTTGSIGFYRFHRLSW